MQKEINLKSIFEVIRSKIVIILAITIAVAVLTVLYTALFVTPMYQSSVDICLRSDIEDSSATSGANERNLYLYANDLMDTCIETLKAGDALDEVTQRLGEMNPSYKETKLEYSDISVSQVNDSNIISVTVVTSDPQLSYDACVAFEAMAQSRVPEVGELTIYKTDSPDIAESPVSPNMIKNCFIAIFASFILSAVVFVLLAQMDSTVKDGNDVAEQLDMLLLAEIPDILNATEQEYVYATRAHGGTRK